MNYARIGYACGMYLIQRAGGILMAVERPEANAPPCLFAHFNLTHIDNAYAFEPG